jgi:hypothetical protein
LTHNAARTALSVLAIALGVALGYAVQLINQAAINELSFGVQTLSGEADLDVRGPRGGFDEAIYPALAAMPEVAVASPVVEVEARLATDRTRCEFSASMSFARVIFSLVSFRRPRIGWTCCGRTISFQPRRLRAGFTSMPAIR